MKQKNEFSDETKKHLLREAWYRCQACKSKSQLTFHHKKKRSSQGEELSSKRNGCVLCQPCHMIADNPRTEEEIWRFSLFNTKSYQEIGQTEREQLLWESANGVRNWSIFIDSEE